MINHFIKNSDILTMKTNLSIMLKILWETDCVFSLAHWVQSPWGECTKTCGGGKQTAPYYCSTEQESDCVMDEKPVAEIQDCNTDDCRNEKIILKYMWRVYPSFFFFLNFINYLNKYDLIVVSEGQKSYSKLPPTNWRFCVCHRTLASVQFKEWDPSSSSPKSTAIHIRYLRINITCIHKVEIQKLIDFVNIFLTPKLKSDSDMINRYIERRNPKHGSG